MTTDESDNYFHFNDNRVLPEHVTAEIANAEGWWYKPDYIINELNINSAIAYPGLRLSEHDLLICLYNIYSAIAYPGHFLTPSHAFSRLPIAYPGHQQVVPLTGGKQMYTVKGYAYSGGGRKVIRLELSIVYHDII